MIKSFPLFLVLVLSGLCMVALLPGTPTLIQRNLLWVSAARVGYDINVVDGPEIKNLVNDAATAFPYDAQLARLSSWIDQRFVQADTVAQNQSVVTELEQVLASLALSDSVTNTHSYLTTIRMVAETTDRMDAWIALGAASQFLEDQPTINLFKGILGEREPAHTFPQALSPMLTIRSYSLSGYDWIPLSTEPNGLIRLVLYWDITAPASQDMTIDAAGKYARWENRLVQVVDSVNLVRHGDMEYSPFERILPLPAPWKLYPHDRRQVSFPAEVIETARNGQYAMHLSGREEDTLLVDFVELTTEQFYLLVGDFTATEAGVFMVMHNVDGVNVYPLHMNTASMPALTSLGGILSVEESEFHPGIYWGVRGASGGSMTADNIGMFELDLSMLEDNSQ